MEKTVASTKNNKIEIKTIKISRYIDANTIIFAIMGFLLSKSILIGSIAPLGISFFLYISRIERYKIPVFISTLIGIALSGNSMSYIFKYCVCMLIFMSVSKIIKSIDSILRLAFIGSAVVIPISIGQAFLSDRYIYDIFLAGIEGVITFISIYIFSYGIALLANINNRISIRIEEAISIGLIATFSIIGIGDMNIFGVSVRIVAATILILISSILGGSTMGATSGVIVGMALIINNITSVIYMGIYSFAGLVSGAFSKFNKYFCVLGYMLSWIMIYSYTSGFESNLTQIRDMLIACLIVVILPEKFYNKAEKLVKTNVTTNDVIYDYIMRSKNITNNRLINMYKAYEDLAITFDNIREKEKIIDQRDIATIIDMIHNEECKSCGMKRRCWEMKFNHTYSLMYDILEKLEENGEITINDASDDFVKECIKPESVIKVSNYYYKMFVIDYNWSLRFAESRRLIANQIRSISKSIKSLSSDLETNIILDIEKERSIHDQLQRNGIQANRVSYISKGEDDFEITIEKKLVLMGVYAKIN